MKDNVILQKSMEFAVRIVHLYQYLYDTKKEYTLSKQLLRAGTSIGANTKEATQAQSRKDFSAKMNIALKEAVETEYWNYCEKPTTLLNSSLQVFIPIVRNSSASCTRS